MKKTIYVTQPYLPPLEEFIPYLKKIWDNKVLTNSGQFHQELELALCNYLGVEHLSLFSNGTIALVTALQTLHISGEVITTPYSFVATTHALYWNNIKPVFVDIDPTTCNLDPGKIEAAITPQTTAILPVHCYGNPCATEYIQEIADIYGLKVIYDAAHAFGVKYKGENLLKHGDLSILSFHATKVFNTFEGGAIICPDLKTKQRIDYLKNFGFADEVTVVAPGINGKMSEFNAALGLLQLKDIETVLSLRREIETQYRNALAGIKGISLLPLQPHTERNSSYFPIFINSNYPVSRDQLYQKMKTVGIYPRRYFYPLISNMPMYRGLPSADKAKLYEANRITNEVLCLPIYPDLSEDEVQRIIQMIVI
ncbi:DegT/DnrJ/EryC1/StrS family aminotransferase [Candidatus Venteria ishoeyi]|uniref:dTDP-4-amino-4,6-dideoxy-D-glucose transaminase n=1 Tax=Candidatus Venteria ishoeyi TaxID=1899563 RepID=A0A1H6FGR4_9GAMM|nr:DegT/DnrJ/EryC1/StrS family aminotransferase [Candidatus Venteria ishoeyi]SEH08549.1 dTDP-4-amino-4%2C6-dideoxy-D-glucose transaminase [Candidatus Venteria ishoeyi]